MLVLILACFSFLFYYLRAYQLVLKMSIRSIVIANSKHDNDDLFDLDLLNDICSGLDNYTEYAIESNLDKPSDSKASAKTLKFPEQLRLILDEGQHLSAISWQCGGSSFAIHDDVLFQELLPVYFRTSKWKSFQKQLNNYGIKKVEGKKRTYFHKYFVRDDPKLVSRMKKE